LINLRDDNVIMKVLTKFLTWVRLESMKIIVLTGGIGSGKSAAASMLKELGAGVIDSDKLGHEVLEKGSPGWQEVIDTFGRDILTEEGFINRKKLARIVFKNPESLQKLDKIVHPRVDEEVEARLEKYRKEGMKAAFVEMAILVDCPWMQRVNQIWAVKAPKDIILKRLKERGVNESDALARMANQPPAEAKVKEGLVIINNDGNLNSLRGKLEKLWHEIHNEDRG
jgi:dephospho-CoA kinase